MESEDIVWEDFDHLLGTMVDRELASLIGCKVWRVYRRRWDKGIEPRRIHSCMHPREWHKDVGKMPNVKIARKYGISRERVRQFRKLIGAPIVPTRAVRFEDNTPEILDELAKESVRVVAEKYGISNSTARCIAKRNGIHPPSPYSVKFTGYDHLLGTMPDREVASLVGCHFMTVLRRRKVLGVPGYRKRSASS